MAAGKLTTAQAIGLAVGKVINKHKMAKHLTLDIAAAKPTYSRDQTKMDTEAALDGIYVVRTPLPPIELDNTGVVAAYKALSHVE